MYGGCVTDEQCADVFADEAFICVKTETHIGCYPGCETDDDCETQFFSGWVCASVSVDGRPYCVPPPGCDPDPCSGYGVCDPETGLCQCFDDADCSADPNLVCHLF